MKPSRTFGALLVAGLVLVPAIGTRAQAQKPLSMPGYPAVGAAPVVTLLAPGAEPRRPLRYKIAAAHKSTMELSMTMGMNINADGSSMPIDLPPMLISANLDVTGVAPNGDFTFDLVFTKFGVGPGANPNVASAMETAGAGIIGLKGTATVTNRGVTKSVKLDFSKIDPAMQQFFTQMTSSVENLSVPFPEEAVGVGAKWEVRQAMGTGGMTMFQKFENELTAMDASTATLRVKVEQVAPPQAFSNPAMPPGLDSTLDKMSGTGTGTMTIHFDSLVPTSTVETVSSMAMSVSMGGTVQSMTTDTRMKMSVAPGVRK